MTTKGLQRWGIALPSDVKKKNRGLFVASRGSEKEAKGFYWSYSLLFLAF